MKFTQEHQMFRQSVRKFVDQEINPYVDAWEEAEEFPSHELFKKMGDLGFLGPSYPEEFGGLGLDYSYNVVLAEEISRTKCAGVPMAIAVQTDMATPALAMFGSDELKREFLAPAIRGEMVASIAVTEPSAGSDVAAILTRAESDGDDYIINGSKTYITNGCKADWLCLLARTTPGTSFRGMSLIVVPTTTPGVSVGRKLKKMGNLSSDTAELHFENVRVPKSYCIGQEGMGFILQMQQFQKERLIGSVLAAGGAESIVRMTIRYCKERKTFGQPLIENQWIHFHIAELLTEIECLRQLNYSCARRMIEGEDVTREVSMAKLKAGRLVRQVADTCIQFHGGMGYMEEYPMARYYRDARLLSIGGGADEIMLGIIAKLEDILPSRKR
ncbi:MAG: acyl-CoA dehydrogenase family protein [Myxococcales bacterium]|nr:acyl-CoA dehydrogenase family protein [Myxococcales bacterium]